MIESLADLEKLCARVSCRLGWVGALRFRAVDLERGKFGIAVCATVRCSRSGELLDVGTGITVVEPGMQDELVFHGLLNQAKALMAHEVEEAFQVDGGIAFDPHLLPAQILQTLRRTSVLPLSVPAKAR